MNNNGAPSASETKVDKDRVAGGAAGRALVALSAFLALAAVGLGIWGYSEHVRANQLAAPIAAPTATLTSSPTATLTSVPTATLTATPSGWSIADLSAFESAFESGKDDRVRALFTENGIITTAGDIYEAFLTGELEGAADARVGSKSFHRLAVLHGGQDFTILGTPVQVEDDTVAFGFRWSDGTRGTALLHLRRDGKIIIAILNPTNYSFGD